MSLAHVVMRWLFVNLWQAVSPHFELICLQSGICANSLVLETSQFLVNGAKVWLQLSYLINYCIKLFELIIA